MTRAVLGFIGIGVCLLENLVMFVYFRYVSPMFRNISEIGGT